MSRAPQGWYDEAIAAVSEGFCPHHRTPLRATGWCPECGTYGSWWSIEHENPAEPLVVITYANPFFSVYPED